VTSTLEAAGITVEYGGVRAVDTVDLVLRQGESIGVVGPNGSGKTSLLNALSGLTPCAGTMSVDGRPARLGNPVAVHRAGVARTFQTPQVYAELTCLDNVLLTTGPGAGTGFLGALLPAVIYRKAEATRREAALGALARFGLGPVADRRAEGLSYGQRRLLELARALAGEPRFLLLDEPSAGLNETETEHLARTLAPLRQEGIGIVVVDHKVGFLDALCDQLVFLRQGAVVTRGRPSEVWSDEAVVDAYLGRRTAHA
jgi:ABC-type branched-subunit amino acid transport system ATPase component